MCEDVDAYYLLTQLKCTHEMLQGDNPHDQIMLLLETRITEQNSQGQERYVFCRNRGQEGP